MISTEYIGSIVIVLVSILHALGIDVASEAIQGLVVGAIALFVAIRRHRRGDINALGVRI